MSEAEDRTHAEWVGMMLTTGLRSSGWDLTQPDNELLKSVVALIAPLIPPQKESANEALLPYEREKPKVVEGDNPSSPDPKARSSPPDKELPTEGTLDYQWQSYSVTLRILGTSRRQAVRLALAAGASHIHFHDPIPVAWLRREDDTKTELPVPPVSEVPGLPHELIDRELRRKRMGSEE